MFHSRYGRRVGVAMIAGGATLLLWASPAQANSGNGQGQNNRGDVWTDNVGQPAGPGHEQDPHLACADIYLWASDLDTASGHFTIDGWNPSGSGTGDEYAPGGANYQQDQAWPGTKANPSQATWTYDSTASDPQHVAQIDVQTLIAHAEANGDTPQAQQGYHFKLQFSQFPQKHKTFWIDCTPEQTPTPTPESTPTPTPTPEETPTPTPTPEETPTPTPTPEETPTPTPTPEETPTPTPTPTPTGSVQPATSTPTPSDGGTPTPHGGVLAVSTPSTGAGEGIGFGLGLGLMGLGFLTAVTSRRRETQL